MFSLVIPVYKNEGSIGELLDALDALGGRMKMPLEVVFVVDGSPDRCHLLLREALPTRTFRSQLLLHSRNFGSFAAIRTGLQVARGELFGVMAADLQEPPSLAEQFAERLSRGDVDVVIGERQGRDDPLFSKLASAAFWGLYRRWVEPQIPPGGVDVFSCNARCRDALVSLPEANSSLVGLLFWVGFRRATVPYVRLVRRHGKSAWTTSKKIKYLLDSVYSFTDLPLRLLTRLGMLALTFAVLGGLIVLVARLTHRIDVPGYAVLVLLSVFFGGLNAFGLGIIGGYVWRTFENTKQRPHAITMMHETFDRTLPAPPRRTWGLSRRPGRTIFPPAGLPFMAQVTHGLRAILSSPTVYELTQRAFGIDRLRTFLASEMARVRSGERVLEMGCGVGSLVDHLPRDVRYVGFDLSDAYIEHARERYGHRGEFRCERVSEQLGDRQRVDVVFASGVLHHLDDDEAAHLFRVAAAQLVDGGRLVTADPAWVPAQSPVARYLIAKDRGQNVRSPEAYAALARPFFETVDVEVRHDLYNLPYSHALLRCARPRRVEGAPPTEV